MRTVHLALIDNSEDRDDRRPRDRARQDALPGLRRATSRTCTATRTSATAPRTTSCCTAPAPTITSCSIPTSSSRPTRSRTRCAGSTRTRRSARSRRARATPTARREYLCKRYPAIFDLFLRGFAPAFLRRLFRRRLDRYEMRDVMDVNPPRDVLRRTGAVRRVHAGASASRSTAPAASIPRFFLYFEDYDWSVRLNRITKTAYVPSVRDQPSRRARGAQGLAPRRTGSCAAASASIACTAGSGSEGPTWSSSPARTASSAARAWRGFGGRPRGARSGARAFTRHRGAAAISRRRGPHDRRRPTRSQRAAWRDGRRAPRRASASAGRAGGESLAALRRVNVDVTDRLARAAAPPAPRISCSRAR